MNQKFSNAAEYLLSQRGNQTQIHRHFGKEGDANVLRAVWWDLCPLGAVASALNAFRPDRRTVRSGSGIRSEGAGGRAWPREAGSARIRVEVGKSKNQQKKPKLVRASTPISWEKSNKMDRVEEKTGNLERQRPASWGCRSQGRKCPEKLRGHSPVWSEAQRGSVSGFDPGHGTQAPVAQPGAW